MGKHLRKLFSADQVKEVFRRYLARQIGVDQASAMLKIRRRQFFKLLKVYRDGPERFSLESTRKTPPSELARFLGYHPSNISRALQKNEC